MSIAHHPRTEVNESAHGDIDHRNEITRIFLPRCRERTGCEIKSRCGAEKYRKCPYGLTLKQETQRLPVVDKDVVVDMKEFIAQREPCGRAYNAYSCQYVM